MARDLESKLRSAEQIGAILKAKRESQDMSQRDIAMALGYRNINFISMIESGRSNPPLARVSDICRVYGMEAEFVAVMVKELYPETWQVIQTLLSQHKDVFIKKSPAALKKAMDKTLAKYLADI